MKPSLRLLPLVASIFFVVSGGPFGLEPALSSGFGVAMLMIVLVPIIWAVPAALLTAELASAIPSEGGYYVWVKRGLGPFAGFLCAWWTWLYSWVDVAIYPTLFAAYVHKLIQISGNSSMIESNPWVKWAVGLVVIVPFTWLNIRGTKLVGATSTIFLGLLVLPFAMIVALGLPRITGLIPSPAIAPGMNLREAATATLFVIMWNYLGWDSMSTVAGEVENPQRNFPRALAYAMPLIVLVYLLPTWIGASVLPQLSAWKEGSWTDVANILGGPPLALAMTLAGTIGTAGLFSATLLASSRIPFVLAEDSLLPHALTKIHPRYGTPYVAVLVSALFYTVFSFSSFTKLAEIDVLLYAAGLVLEFAALVALRVKEPELPRPYRIPGGWPALTIVCILPISITAFALRDSWVSSGPGLFIEGGLALASGVVLYGLLKLRRL